LAGHAALAAQTGAAAVRFRISGRHGATRIFIAPIAPNRPRARALARVDLLKGRH
jgi:hypothetical protein